jgi:prepilin signal peptidase PulO-like enzyme (type II secretory pathway)
MFINIIVFVLGLCVGSFLNMAIYRTAVRYGISNLKFKIKNDKRSYCDFCGRQLRWYENVPVVSWIILKGRTRCCDKKLPIGYPLLEIFMGIIFLLIGNNIVYLIIGSLLMFSLVFDLKYMILPDRTNLALVAISLFMLIGKTDYINYLLAGLGSLFFFFILNRIKIRGSEAMGMGDVKYTLFMGLFLGWPNTLVAIYFAFVVGAMLSIILLLLKKVKKENPIPFGPFLIVGTVVANIWGESLIKIFLRVLS